MEIYKAKQALRKDIASRKKGFSTKALHSLSEKVLANLERTEAFKQASHIAFYHSIAGEVQTAAFIEKWHKVKKISLPVVEGNDLRLLPYTGNESLTPGAYGILEPIASEEVDIEKDIDLIIVPGVAFDRQRNRLGRGKGYYDRLLSSSHTRKVGICFGFQLLPHIPVEPFDQKMDGVITEEEVITE